MAIQDKFSSKNVIYKITSDVDLEGGTLTVPAGCTLDFQGGSINNGTVRGNGAYVSGETSGCSAKFEDVVYFTSGQETALNGMVVEINNRMVEVEDRFNDSLDDMNLKINYIDNKVAKANSTASKAEAKADSAISTSNEAANTATIAKNAVATLEGLADADEAQQTLAAQVVQIEENKQNIALNKAETDEKLTELASQVGVYNGTIQQSNNVDYIANIGDTINIIINGSENSGLRFVYDNDTYKQILIESGTILETSFITLMPIKEIVAVYGDVDVKVWTTREYIYNDLQSVKSEIREEIIPIKFPSLSIATLNSSTGNIQTATNRCVTDYFIKAPFSLSCNEGYNIYRLFKYNVANDFNFEKYIVVNTNKYEVSEDGVYKVVFNKVDDTAFIQSELNNVCASYINPLSIVVDSIKKVEEATVAKKYNDISNLFEYGYYVTTKGEPVGDIIESPSRLSCKLDVVKGENYRIIGAGGSSGKLWAKVSDGIITSVASGTDLKEVVINCDGTFDSLIFNVNASLEYSLEKIIDIPINEYVSENKFTEKSMAIIGDSAVDASNWAKRLFKELKVKQGDVYAIGGYTWRNKYDEDGNLYRCVGVLIENMLSSGVEYDIIQFQIGGNDIANSTTLLGTAEAAFSSYNVETLRDATDTYSCMRYYLQKVRNRYPNALIIVGTIFQRLGTLSGDSAKSVSDIIKEVCHRLCIKVIDGESECGFSPMFECHSPYYNDGNPGVVDDRTSLSRTNPIYNYIDVATNEVVTYEIATDNGVLKDGYSKRYGLYTYDGKHQNEAGEDKVFNYMLSKIKTLF